MLITNEILIINAKKFDLDVDKFKFTNRKSFIKKKYYLIYKPYNYIFQIDKNQNDLDNFFPYFSKKHNYSNIECWCSSIKETLIKSNKIVKDLKNSENLRYEFKKKYNV